MSNANNDTEDPETQVEPTSESIDTNNDDNNNITCDTNNNQPRSRSSLVGPPRTVTEGETSSEDDDKSELVLREESWITMDSDLRDPSRRICIVTTAALPWRTGTAVNPLMRALYLTRGRPKHYVTLVIPFLDNLDDRVKTLGEEYRDMSTQQEQEAWIRDFCRERAGCSEEEQNLKIIFYESKYYDSFGSIFPMEDICALIPEEEADVAILEEPEHLNWLRAPKPYKGDETSETANDNKNMDKSQTTSTPPYTEKEKAELGWKFKFKHVVGIVHTNYKAYSEEYGQAAKYITTPMLNALNSLVIRAYCHRVILLSETLPSLCSYKEVTRNVHGVRNEFFESPQSRSDNDDSDNIDTNAKGEKYAPVYFIGKTIWAKGFDKILELEKIYREKHGDYFTIDVYGMGGDEKAVQRAFFGRIPHIQRKEATQDDADSNTADVFKWNDSIRSHLSDTSKETPKEESNNDTEGAQRAATTSNDDGEQGKRKGSLLGFVGDMTQKIAPLSVLGDLSKQAFSTTKTATSSAATAVKNVADAGKHVAFAPGSPMRPNAKEENKMRMVFAPPRSADEFRRNPIPARFLGAKDHALIRDIPEHKIFLNCSITEVLCTTTAEALAMGKFVILPKHPSNTFFYQFPNCLPYSDLEEGLEKLEWALENDPRPLSKETIHKLSWEGANDRLFEASAISKDELDEWQETGKIKDDEDAARFHVDTAMKGQLVQKYFGGVFRNGEPTEVTTEAQSKTS